MALCGRLAGRSSRWYRTRQITIQSTCRRSLATSYLLQGLQPRIVVVASPLCPHRRTFASSGRRAITGQEAPSSKAYIESGVIGNQKNLVDVKKVLVIGSGGLSIGQAGEFDYSGKPWSVMALSMGGRLKALGLRNQRISGMMTLTGLSSRTYRIPSAKGAQRSQCRVSPNQSQYRYHTNRP